MESRLDHDFSAVRVHADADAAASARAVAAKAYTLGQDVVFAAGRYEPGSSEGRRLLAHELAHVVQQAGAPHLTGPPRIGEAGACTEHEAHRVADHVAGGWTAPMIRQTGVMLLQAEDDPAELRAQLATLERRAALPVSLSPDEMGALQGQRDALQERLAAAVRTSSRPTSGTTASSGPAVSTALPARAAPSPVAAVGENPTPESMVRLVVEQRHFTSVPPTREGGIPPISTEVLAEGARGRAAGPGWQTNAAIKVLDAQGRQVAFELAQYLGSRGPHAEAQGVARLRLRLGGRTFPGGRLVVAVDQVACPGCMARLRALALELGLRSFEVWVPAPQEGRTATPKTTARTAAMEPARQGPVPVSETPGGTAYRYEPRLLQGESFIPGVAPPSSAGPFTESPTPTPRGAAAETPPASAPPDAAAPEAGSRGPTPGRGRWSGVGSGVTGLAAPLLAGYLHQRAVRERVREQATSLGYVPRDAPSGKGLLYDLGAWLLDPSREAEANVPPKDRINVSAWRARIRAVAAARAIGETIPFAWDVGECRSDPITGRQAVIRREVIYRKEANQRWVVVEGNASGTIDLNRIIALGVPDAEIAAAILANPCSA
jgi:hypothetical protein